MQERQVVIAGERGGQKSEELASAPRQLYRPAVTPVAVITAETSRRSAARASRGAGAGDARVCERCGEPLPAGLRPDARYCSKRCRQAASRQRLKDRPPSPPPTPAETCSWCGGPMPGGLRVEALARLFLEPYRLGDSDDEDEHRLLLDRYLGTLDVGLARDVEQLLATQPSALHALTAGLPAGETEALLERLLDVHRERERVLSAVRFGHGRAVVRGDGGV